MGSSFLLNNTVLLQQCKIHKLIPWTPALIEGKEGKFYFPSPKMWILKQQCGIHTFFPGLIPHLMGRKWRGSEIMLPPLVFMSGYAPASDDDDHGDYDDNDDNLDVITMTSLTTTTTTMIMQEIRQVKT